MMSRVELCPKRCPNVIIPGVQRSGTTYLAGLLAQHPDVFLPIFKEPSFFAAIDRPRWLYPNRSQVYFAIDNVQKYEALYAGQEETRYRVDASTMYFSLPSAREHIAQACPGAKILILIRNPVERAYSAFSFYRQNGEEKLDSFSRAYEEERSRIAEGLLSWSPYFESGHYAGEIARWMDAFGRDNVLVVNFDELRSDIAAALARVCRFLELPTHAFDLGVDKNSSVLLVSRVRLSLLSFATGGAFYNNTLRRIVRGALPFEARLRIREWLRRHLLRGQARAARRPDPITDSEFNAYLDTYIEDLSEVEKLTGLDLSAWKIRRGLSA